VVAFGTALACDPFNRWRMVRCSPVAVLAYSRLCGALAHPQQIAVSASRQSTVKVSGDVVRL